MKKIRTLIRGGKSQDPPPLPPKEYDKRNPVVEIQKRNTNYYVNAGDIKGMCWSEDLESYPGVYEEIKDGAAPPQQDSDMYVKMDKPRIKTPTEKLNVVPDSFDTVVAIDFGTAASGFAYSHFKTKDNVQLNDNWGQAFGAAYYKCPTCVSVKDDEFSQFGFEALKEYVEESEVDSVELFREFKMQLAGQENLGRYMILRSDYKTSKPSKEKSALVIFAMALTFFKECLLKTIMGAGITPSIRWVITVPALWSDVQKFFMREAAVKAGLIDSETSDNLLIALEPECASLYCRTITTNKFQGGSGNTSLNLPLGAEYIVVDAGGGTIDITVHRVGKDGNSEEIFQPTGLTVGGTNVNQEFEKFLEKVFTKNFADYCKKESPSLWLNLILNFEKKKLDIDEDLSKPLDILIEYGLSNCFEEFHDQSLRSYMALAQKPEGVTLTRNGNLSIESSNIKTIVKPTIDKIIDHLEYMFAKPALQNIKTMFIVGGFGKCAPLQKQIRCKFGVRCKILIPEEPSLCVLKGAVMFGHRPNFITSRIAKYTYALLISREYKKGKDNQSRCKMADNGEKYVETLHAIVSKGDAIPLNSIRRTETEPLVSSQWEVDVAVYASESKDVEDPNDSSVKKLGNITTHIPKSAESKNRRVTVEMIFGGTEIKVRGITATGTIIETTVNMLL